MLKIAGAPELTGRISPSEMGHGIRAANRNARRILCDGMLLYKGRRYPTATALAVLAMEEAMKWWTLVHVTILQDGREVHAVWKESRLHEPKLERALMVLMDAYENVGGVPSNASITQLANSTQSAKLRCIYTAFVSGRRWVNPSDVCDAEQCHSHLGVAFIVTSEHLRMTGQRLGALLKEVPDFLGDEAEQEARQATIAWSESEEAAALAAEDDAEDKAFAKAARRCLKLSQ